MIALTVVCRIFFCAAEVFLTYLTHTLLSIVVCAVAVLTCCLVTLSTIIEVPAPPHAINSPYKIIKNHPVSPVQKSVPGDTGKNLCRILP